MPNIYLVTVSVYSKIRHLQALWIFATRYSEIRHLISEDLLLDTLKWFIHEAELVKCSLCLALSIMLRDGKKEDMEDLIS